MNAALAMSVIAVLVSLWALHWRRRAAIAAERSANEAIKSAAAAEASASAATRSAAAAEQSAATAAEALSFARQQAEQSALRQRKQWLDGLVDEGMRDWPQRGSVYHIVNREPSLTDGEIQEFVRAVFSGRGRTLAEADAHLTHVLERREKHLKGAGKRDAC